MSSPTQLQNITTQLNTYFTQLAAFFTSAGNPTPSFEDFVALLDYSNLLDDAVAGEIRSASFSTGAAADVVHLVIAINREFGMRGKVKGQYYTDGSADATTMADFYTALYGEYFNYLRGTSPDQGRV